MNWVDQLKPGLSQLGWIKVKNTFDIWLDQWITIARASCRIAIGVAVALLPLAGLVLIVSLVFR